MTPLLELCYCATELNFPQVKKELHIYSIITSGNKDVKKQNLHLLVGGFQTVNLRTGMCELSPERKLN